MKTASLIIMGTLYDHCLKTGLSHPHMIIANELLKDGELTGSEYTMNDIKQTVYRILEVRQSEVESRSRKRECVLPRQIAMYFIHKFKKFGWSLAVIGWSVGRRDHATVLHAIKTINNLMDTDTLFRDRIRYIEYQLIKRYEL